MRPPARYVGPMGDGVSLWRFRSLGDVRRVFPRYHAQGPVRRDSLCVVKRDVFDGVAYIIAFTPTEAARFAASSLPGARPIVAGSRVDRVLRGVLRGAPCRS